MKMKAKSLVQSWLEVELNINGRTLSEALFDMNKSLGSAHTHSRVREWAENRNGRGKRLPREVRIYMAKVVMPYVLKSAGVSSLAKIDKRTINRLVEQLC